MKISLYDKIKLRDGRNAVIVDIYEQDVAYEADIKTDDDYITDTIKHSDILEIIEN